MKNFTHIITMAFMAAAVSASAQVGVTLPKAPLLAGTPNDATPVTSFNPIPVALQQGMTNILFYEDFANGFAGNNGIGAWSAEDTGDGLIWQAVDSEGAGYFANGTASGVFPPAGEFSTNIGTLNSTTAANGWMVFDCDYYNTPISEGYENTEGWITSPILDFGNVGSVIIAWDQYFRYCCYPDAPIYLQVSSDGGASWTTFDAHGTFIESANSASVNPLPTSVDISCAAAYQSNVLIRFSHLQAPETGDAYSHYYWGIDDVTIYENTTSNDLEAVQLTNGDVFNVFEYRITPMEQRISASEGGLIAGLMYRNNGVQDEDAVVLVEVLNSDGAIIHTVQEGIGTVSAPVNATVCPNPPQDSVYIQTGWAPVAMGTYTLRATISSTAGSDFTPENNVISKTIVFTDYEMGHDDEGMLDYEFTPQDSEINGLFNPCGYGSFFHMQNAGSLAYGIAVRFGPNSGGGDLEFETRLYTFDGAVSLTDSPFESTYWVYSDSWTPDSTGNGEYVYLPFDDPIELTNENFYFAGVISEFESEAQLTVLGNADSDTDGSTGDYGLTGAGDFTWFTSQTATPAIRLVLSPEPFIYPGCTDLAACNYDADAEEDDGSCEYDSCVGCTDDLACNFNPSATISDPNACTYPGCQDPTASNYDATAGCAGECLYLTYDCASIGDEAWTAEGIGLFPDWQDAMHGVPWEGEWVFNIPATIVEPGSGVSYGVHHVEWSSVTGIPSWATTDYALADLEASSQHCIAASGTPATPGLHEITASGEVFISIFGQPFSIGEQSYSVWLEVMDNPNPIPGCTYPLASNYLPYATSDNGSCVFFGCTDPNAADFNPFANIDDGSCGDGCDPTDDDGCSTDANNDGAVNVTDLLMLLGEFGLECE